MLDMENVEIDMASRSVDIDKFDIGFACRDVRIKDYQLLTSGLAGRVVHMHDMAKDEHNHACRKVCMHDMQWITRQQQEL